MQISFLFVEQNRCFTLEITSRVLRFLSTKQASDQISDYKQTTVPSGAAFFLLLNYICWTYMLEALVFGRAGCFVAWRHVWKEETHFLVALLNSTWSKGCNLGVSF